MTHADELLSAGASPAAIAFHYDLPAEFFGLWLGNDLVYSCGLWSAGDDLAAAQRRKLDWFAERLAVGGARVLDVGCGWGALLDRFARHHGIAGGVGLTLSAAQTETARTRRVPGVEFRTQSWADYQPVEQFDAITAVESTEHFASDRLTPDEKVDVYQHFFERAASWLADGGRLGLQLICLDGAGHETSRPGGGPVTELINRGIFPESMSSSLGEMALAWERQFRLVEFADHSAHYVRTFRAWAAAFRRGLQRAQELVGPETARTFTRYFAAGEMLFRLREQALYRIVLAKRPEPKQWATQLLPSTIDAAVADAPRVAAQGASTAAVRAHYDVSNDFYAAWLGPSMMYSSGLWNAGDPPDLELGTARKIDYFAQAVLGEGAGRVLDIGCGWGGTLRRLVAEHGITDAVGLTLSAAQAEFIASADNPALAVHVAPWETFVPDATFDAIFSFGAFEHFARDGMTSAQRVARYRQFFERCYTWLRPDGRLALETITHDDAPDIAGPLGRGPLGDVVLELFPESLCPQLCEVVLGFEPWFEVEVLRSDAADFARTFRAWHIALRNGTDAATEAAGADVVRRYRQYLAACEVQFRDGTLSNLRLVLHRRHAVKR
jgi:cyclopropane-fatty-acyl-phospholipid synthase